MNYKRLRSKNIFYSNPTLFRLNFHIIWNISGLISWKNKQKSIKINKKCLKWALWSTKSSRLGWNVSKARAEHLLRRLIEADLGLCLFRAHGGMYRTWAWLWRMHVKGHRTEVLSIVRRSDEFKEKTS